MCSIFILEPGQMIDEDKLDNAVANNLDGYGVILHNLETKKLETVKAYTQGGTKTEDVLNILKYNMDRRRYVHLRNQTHGVINSENAHPFKVFSSDDRDVWLMHNGTIHTYRPPVNDDRSDTRMFTDLMVTPLLEKFKGEFGYGDYNDPLVKTILAKFSDAGSFNRILLVSNDLEPLLLGNWSKIKNKDGTEFLASNDSYFNAIVRGPRKPVVPFQRHNHWNPTGGMAAGGNNSQVSHLPQQKQEEKKKEEVKKVTPLAEAGINSTKAKYQVPEKVTEALGDWYEDFGFYGISWLKFSELEKLVKELSVSELAGLIYQMGDKLNEWEGDLDIAEQTIQELKRGSEDNDEESYRDVKADYEILQALYEKTQAEKDDMARDIEQLKAQISGSYIDGAYKEAA